MRVTIQEVTVESVSKGRANYEVATVVYITSSGDTRTQKIMSFANPQVFKDVQTLSKGQEVEVTLVKDARGYTNWSKISTETAKSPASETPTASSRPQSNYETREERAARQVYIIRQSSLERAIQLLSIGAKVPPDVNDVLNLATVFTDYVTGNSEATPEGDMATE
jgi:hypothetical protein